MKNLLHSIKALSEETRVRLLLLLDEREACVCELMAVFDMAQSKLSHHLITLRDAGFLQDEKRGKWNYYRIDREALTPENRELLASLSRWLAGDELIDRDTRALAEIQHRMKSCCRGSSPLSQNQNDERHLP